MATTTTGGKKHERSLVLEGASALVGFGLRTISGIAGTILGAELIRRGETLDGPKGSSAPKRVREAPGTISLTRTITIHKRIDEVWPFVADPARIARAFAQSEEEVRTHGTDLHVEARGPLGLSLSRDLERVDIRDREMIAWTDVRRSGLPDRLLLKLREAPAGRGTEVTAELVLSPPAGAIGRMVLRTFEEFPKQALLAVALRRLQSLIETGEIPVSNDTSCRKGGKA